MGDHERRASRPQPGHGLLHQHLGAGVDRRGRLVQDQHLGVGDERPRDGDQLLLTSGDVRPLLVDQGLVAVGQLVDEGIHVGRGGGGDHLVPRGPGLAVRDVLADGATEQPGLLQHHAEFAAQRRPRHRGDVDPVQQDLAAVDLVETLQQVDQGGLAGAGGAHDGDGLAGFGLHTQARDQRTLRGIAEVDITELDVPLDHLGQLAVGLRAHLDGIQHLEDPLGRGDARLQQVGHRRDLGDRLGEHPRVLDEGLHVAQRHSSVCHLQPADHRDDHVVQVPDQGVDRHDDARDELRPEGRVEQLLVGLVEDLRDFALASEDLDQRMPGVGLLDLAVQLAGGCPHAHELLLRPLADDR